MFTIHSLTGRIVLGKAIGFTIGLLAMLILPFMDIPILSTFGIGTLLMFTMMGAMIGFVGIYTRHPLIDMQLPWWLRSSAIGFAFMLMYVLLAYDTIEVVMQSSLVTWTGLESPYWALIDGIIYGLLMGYITTKFAGEGENLPLR